MRGRAFVMALAACSYEHGTTGGAPDDGRSTDSAAPGDAKMIDAPAPTPLMLVDDSTIYAVDVDAMAATVVGPIHDSNGSISVDGFAYDGTNFLAITPGGGALLTIDKTGLVTASVNLTPAHAYGGLTYVPAHEITATAGDALFAGNSADGKLYSINRLTGATIPSPMSFGSGTTFATDIAWVHG